MNLPEILPNLSRLGEPKRNKPLNDFFRTKIEIMTSLESNRIKIEVIYSVEIICLFVDQ
jgi:hypothetical protein